MKINIFLIKLLKVFSLEEQFDVIVAGAGPGGSTTAAYLGRAGKKVLLLEKAKFPRDKTCGDALSGKSMKVVRELALEAKIQKLPHCDITGVFFSSPSGASVDIPFPSNDPNRKGGTGYCMRRIHTDAMFFDAAKSTKNVQVKENFMVQEVIFQNGYAVGVKGIETTGKRETREFYAKVIVGADGVNSTVARCVLGEKAKLDDKHSCDAVRGYYSNVSGLTSNIEIHFFESVMPGYFWIFPLENGMANVGIGLVSSDLKKRIASKNKNLITIMNDAIQNEPMIKERFKNAKLEGQISGWRLPFGSYRRQLAGNGWVLVGDAASLVDPFSGEGVGNATASGRMAAKCICDSIDDGNVGRDMLSCYEREFWAECGQELNTSYSMQKIGRIKWLLNKVIEKAATKKEIKEFISASLANEDAKKNFKNPLFYLKLLLT